ncbi:MAG: hypothetical protein EBQ89_00460 [Alphaproteobacteria bacterium]|nr:hypothetical protein [Alphaproteobacteria bacterium]
MLLALGVGVTSGDDEDFAIGRIDEEVLTGVRVAAILGKAVLARFGVVGADEAVAMPAAPTERDRRTVVAGEVGVDHWSRFPCET